MLVVHASFPVDPDHRDDALELIPDLVAGSRAENGVIEYRATTDVTDPNVIRFFERYEDEDAFAAHGRSDHFETFEESIGDLLADEPEVVRFDVDSATER
ncbi:putative quinol monooxygenase [Halococcus hamelinensis]|uniref:Antibiotic biosynthesis monooxygenase n=1 Tax=Halococcus hamelinensis 100A6 TaxID=1132509 RepID=M0LZL5_9EURY|nr:putative quinol monooxygenase [Halococcus hamelinensis]EMA38886.1 Antibiotic biosynthesis monooxygenase [Halococcus hamelinensis 100A6]